MGCSTQNEPTDDPPSFTSFHIFFIAFFFFSLCTLVEAAAKLSFQLNPKEDYFFIVLLLTVLLLLLLRAKEDSAAHTQSTNIFILNSSSIVSVGMDAAMSSVLPLPPSFPLPFYTSTLSYRTCIHPDFFSLLFLHQCS